MGGTQAGRVRGVVAVVAAIVLTTASLSVLASPSHADSTWTSPTSATFLSAAGQDASEPEVVSSADGTRLAAIWVRSDGTNTRIEATASSNSGATWSTPALLSAAGKDATAPQIAMSSDGLTVNAVWVRVNSSNITVVQTSQSTDGGVSWNAPGSTPDLSDLTVDALTPRIAASADGSQVVAVWATDDHASTQGISSARSSSGGAVWSGRVDLPSLGTAVEPRVEMSSDGQTVAAAWLDGDIVRASTSSDGAANWGSIKQLSENATTSRHLQVAISATGTNIVAIWCEDDSGGNTLIETSNSVNSGASWLAPTATVALSDTSKEGVEPQVAFSGGTQVTAVWRWKDGSSGVIQTLTSADAGVTWPAISTAKTLSGASDQAYDAHLDVSANGALMTVIWYISATRTVQASSSSDSGVTWSATPTDLSVSSGPREPKPRLAASTDGTKLVAVWINYATNSRVQAGLGTNAAPTPTPTPSPSGPQTQSVVGGCVKSGGAMPASGSKELVAADCKTTAGQVVGVGVSAAARGDVTYYSLYCKKSNGKTAKTRSTGHGDGTRYCKSGALRIRTYGYKLRIRVKWTAPATATFAAYKKVKSFNS